MKAPRERIRLYSGAADLGHAVTISRIVVAHKQQWLRMSGAMKHHVVRSTLSNVSIG